MLEGQSSRSDCGLDFLELAGSGAAGADLQKFKLPAIPDIDFLNPNVNVKDHRHCERSEAIHGPRLPGLPRRCATRNDVSLSSFGVVWLP